MAIKIKWKLDIDINWNDVLDKLGMYMVFRAQERITNREVEKVHVSVPLDIGKKKEIKSKKNNRVVSPRMAVLNDDITRLKSIHKALGGDYSKSKRLQYLLSERKKEQKKEGRVKKSNKPDPPDRKKQTALYDTGNMARSLTHKANEKLLTLGSPFEYAIAQYYGDYMPFTKQQKNEWLRKYDWEVKAKGMKPAPRKYFKWDQATTKELINIIKDSM